MLREVGVGDWGCNTLDHPFNTFPHAHSPNVLPSTVPLRPGATRAYLVAHNGSRFDAPIVRHWIRECGLELPAEWMFVDSLPLLRQYYPNASR